MADLKIDKGFLEDLLSAGDAKWRMLSKELQKRGRDDTVYLSHEARTLDAFYKEVRSTVAGLAREQGYIVLPDSERDAEIICSIMGRGNYSGNMREGYRFRKAA